ncbi:conserved Plasmodium protein, unknown function [Plasmodium ovale wallikeri]|uniref:protein-histidine N-methyltransferase n=1 Tax=Plasmodium ovale wallikeri TaxID=864142 RepID=A0A1A8YMH5_PLAOA|nr:conserved Plasmodium protein, unknown function [Plasmodium ovale wallikeri]SBT46218.1 conserved Plasmodium protein, unknown function [Plasmodium ovale wallikeri]
MNVKNSVNLLSQLGVLKKILFKESLFKILFLLILFNSSIDTKFSILQYGVQNYSWPHSLINYIPLVSQTAKLIGISIFQLYTNKMCYKNYAMITILKRYFLWNIILQMSKNVFIILLLSFLTTCASLLYYFNISLDSLNNMNAPYASCSSLLYSNGKEDMYLKLKNSPKTHYFNINPFSKGEKGITSKKIVRFSEENAKTKKIKDEERKNKPNEFKIASDYSSDGDQWLIIDNLKGNIKKKYADHNPLNISNMMEKINFKNKNILELGCAHGLVGIKILLDKGNVVFQELNKEVINDVLLPNIEKNLNKNLKKKKLQDKKTFMKINNEDFNCFIINKPWNKLNKTLKKKELKPFDFILGNEILYRKENYPSILKILKRNLKENGKAYFGTKSYYFGFEDGAGSNSFLDYVNKNKRFEFIARVVQTDTEKSVYSKDIIEITFAKKN